MTKAPLEVLIFGTGAVGCTVAWRLAQNPHIRLSVVCRSNYEAVKGSGIQMKTFFWGDGQFRPYRVLRTPAEVWNVPFDYIICANKATSFDAFTFARAIAPAVSPNTTLVTAQNGIGIENALRQAFRYNTILSAVCYISCVQTAPGIVQQVSAIRPHAFHVGTFDRRHGNDAAIDQSRLERFVALDNKFKLIPDAQSERWAKQIFNGSWNPVTAISGLDTHGILSGPRPYLQMVEMLAEEIYAVAVKLGIRLAEDMPTKTIEFARNNPSITPSMLQDARQRKEMEVETLCGNIVRQANALGVSVPTVEAVYHKLLEMNVDFQAAKEQLANGNGAVANDNEVLVVGNGLLARLA